MISLLLYGRNDNHGYNLHKRAAISLNALAEVLTDPDDEIIFVDYNTPDDLPTFPEAISDTLSDKAHERLRILRVRPAIHARFRERTHLPALEPISRNIALRRSNPSNRWILSTNTDMIFVPHRGDESLSEIVADLPNGFYQLPRFELPEILWESFDRRDGGGMIERTREWARRFHLNEIVYGSPEILYDGPGDFQLCERTELISIHGFHERMLRGWHVDANLCARMMQLHGKIGSLSDRLYAYHCDHTRQATAMHTHDRVENNAEEFNSPESGPYLTEQAATWGLPEETIEEIRLGRGDLFSRYLGALAAAVPEEQTSPYESAYRTDSYGELTYRRAHVLPFALDLVAPFSPATRVFYAGARSDMFEDFQRGYRALGGAEVVTPSEFGWLGGAGSKKKPLNEALEEADLLIFEFGVGEPDGGDDVAEMMTRLTAVRRAFAAAAAFEQVRVGVQGGARRRVVGVNAIHNEFESFITNYLTFNLTPYSSRLRHGYFAVDASRTANESFDIRAVWRDVQKWTGRQRALPLWETQELSALAVQAAKIAPHASLPSEAQANAEYLIAFLRHDRIEEASGIDAETARALADRLEKERPSRSVRALLPNAGTPRGARTHAGASRVADTSDWESPSFARFVDHHFGGARAYGFPDRNLWTWERATILDVLQQRELLTPEQRILVVGAVPDHFSAALADYVGGVEIARPATSDSSRFLSARGDIENDPHYYEAAIPSWKPVSDDQQLFDAVIFIQDTIMARGPDQVAAALTEAARLLRVGGLLMVTCRAALSGVPHGSEFAARRLLDGRFERNLAASNSGLEFCGPLEATLTRANCDRRIDHNRGDLRYRSMYDVRGLNRVTTAAVITLRRTELAATRSAASAVNVSEATLSGLVATDTPNLAYFRFHRFVRGFLRRTLKLALRSRLGRGLLALLKVRSPRALPDSLFWRGSPESWGRSLKAKPQVKIRDGVFEVEPGFRDSHAIYGPYLVLAPGKWILRFKAERVGDEGGGSALAVDVVEADITLTLHHYTAAELDGRQHEIRFTAMTDLFAVFAQDRESLRIETRFTPMGGAGLRLWDVSVEPDSNTGR